MTSTQLIVLGLLVAAFVSGWVARGEGAGHQSPAEPEPEPAPEPASAGPLLDDAVAALESVIDAWIDRRDSVAALARFETTREAYRRALLPDADADADAALRDAAAALAEASALFGELRAGAPLTARSSRRLDAIEERLAAATSP